MAAASEASGKALQGEGASPSVVRGWRLLWRVKRLWLALWLLHLAAAGLLAWSFADVWNDILGRRLASGELGGSGTAGVVVDLVNHHGQALGRLLAPVGLESLSGGGGSPWVVLAWAWLGAVLSGGIVAQLVRVSPGRKPSLPEALDDGRAVSPAFVATFLWDCGWHLARMTRLLLLHLAVLAVFLATALPLAASLLVSPLGPAPAPDDRFRAGVGVVAIAGLLFLFFGLVHDYARVRVVREHRRSVLLAWWKGMRIVVRRLVRIGGLQVFFVAVVLGTITLWWWWSPSADAGLLTLALAPAGWLLVRVGVRIWWLGSELALFDRLV